ncbi:MAG: rhomboid family intramembrane serine protease [Deltaproteobacteria bacterium]|nr:rhomboid family intramembrane serine protease [Deltaproteobacteria bacterium]
MQMENATPRCPVDHTLLKSLVFNGVTLDQCPNCGGIWFDRNELDETVRRLIRFPQEASAIDVPLGETQDINDLEQYRSLSCPRCRDTKLSAGRFGRISNVVLDTCPRCRGVWADHGELTALVEFMHTPAGTNNSSASINTRKMGEAIASAVKQRQHYKEIKELGSSLNRRIGFFWFFLPKIIIPISARAGQYEFPLMTSTLIVLNVIFLSALELFSTKAGFDPGFLGMIPSRILNGERLYTILTSMFTHAGWFHLFGNMLYLWIFSVPVEDVFGLKKFISMYLAGGITAELVFLALNPQSMIPLVGASGAVSCIMGVYIVRFPSSTVKTFVINRVLDIPAWIYISTWIFYQFLLAFLVKTMGACSTTAFSAHVGGFATGVLLAYLNKNRPVATKGCV